MNGLSNESKEDIRKYLKSQFPNLLKSDWELNLIEEGVFGVKTGDWIYVKQKLLLDQRTEPGYTSITELKNYIDNL